MPDSSSRLKAIIGGSIGNLVEWYDWYAYSAFSLYFASSFFPDSSSTAQLMNTAGIFAVGFLMRPVGGWLFGRIADKQGRKKAMTLSVLLMSFGSLIIAVCPNYAVLGIGAPILLLLARLLQGLSVGGEYGVSATYLSEMAAEKRRGFYSSFQYVTLVGGQLVALGIQLLLLKFVLTEKQMFAWGWRIPFVIGAILALIALYLRKNLHETSQFKHVKAESTKQGAIRELLRYPRAVLTVIGLTLGGTLAFYTFATYLQKYLVNSGHFTIASSTFISAICLMIFVLLQPVFGALSDKVGRKPLLLGFGILGTICTIPLMLALGNVTSTSGAIILMLLALIIVSGYTSINAVVKAELFPVQIRALGVGLPYALTVAVFGGTAEYVALWFKEMGHESWFFIYVTCCIACSLLVYAGMTDTKKSSKIED